MKKFLVIAVLAASLVAIPVFAQNSTTTQIVAIVGKTVTSLVGFHQAQPSM
jgi:opacity protein-like surface antigen